MHDIDDYIRRAGMDVPEDRGQDAVPRQDTGSVESIVSVDLRAAGISTIVWGTGYRYDFSWIRVPVFGEVGYPLHRRGVTSAPGLYFLGLPWLHKRKSGLLFGVGDDAAYLAATISAARPARVASA
jgi:putative flavoprotein involved in K+ transport